MANNGDLNVATIARIGGYASGGYRITFTTPYANTNYCPIAASTMDGQNSGNRLIKTVATNKTTTTVDIIVHGDSNSPDSSDVSLIIMGP
jgi:hypothetical protein